MVNLTKSEVRNITASAMKNIFNGLTSIWDQIQLILHTFYLLGVESSLNAIVEWNTFIIVDTICHLTAMIG